MSGPVCVGRYYDYSEALVAWSALDAAGLQPNLAELHHASIAWHHIFALQGIRLIVNSQDLEAASTVLNLRKTIGNGENYSAPKARAHELVFAAAVLLIAGLPFPIWMRRSNR